LGGLQAAALEQLAYHHLRSDDGNTRCDYNGHKQLWKSEGAFIIERFQFREIPDAAGFFKFA
jgi:hypothetical protein